MNKNDYLAYLSYLEELRKQGKEPELSEKPDFDLPGGETINVVPHIFEPIKKYTFTPDCYDEIRHELKVFNKLIVVPTGNQDSLCKVLFLKYEDMLSEYSIKERKIIRRGRKVWNWDEVLIVQGEPEPDKNRWREIYNAGRAINYLVEKETSNKEFILGETKTVTLNPEYLK